MELIGEEIIDGTSAYKLRVTGADGQIVETFLDKKRCLIVRQDTKATIANRQLKQVSRFSDYKKSVRSGWHT